MLCFQGFDRLFSGATLALLLFDEESILQTVLVWLLRPLCLGCGRPLGRDADFCWACRKGLMAKADPGALLSHQGPALALVNGLRGGGAFTAAAWCERLLQRARCFDDWAKAEIDCVTLAPRANPRKEDGLPLLAQRIAKRLGARYEPLLRKEKGRTQHGKSRQVRMDCAPFVQVQGASAKGKKVLLLDDVDTTGTTLDLAEFRLREAGADSVVRFALAKRRFVPFEKEKALI